MHCYGVYECSCAVCWVVECFNTYHCLQRLVQVEVSALQHYVIQRLQLSCKISVVYKQSVML